MSTCLNYTLKKKTMKIFKKRFFAFLIDLLLLACIIYILKHAWGFRKNTIQYALLFLPLFVRDFTFKGASIGKMIMRIRIYDNEWKTPNYWTLLKRSFIISCIALDNYLLRGYLIGADILYLYDKEKEKLGTQVIDKRVYNELCIKARSSVGYFPDVMSALYDEYLKKLYSER